MDVIYTAGYAAIPDAVKYACAQVVRNAQATPAVNVKTGHMDRFRMDYFAPDLLASKHPGLAQYSQMVRHCRPRERRRRNDLTNVKPLSRFEHQHDALPMRVTQRHKNAGDAPPSLWNCLAVSPYQDYITSYVVALLYAPVSRCQVVAKGFRRAAGR